MAEVTGAAMRLEDYARQSESRVTKGLTESLYKTQAVLKDVKMVTMAALKASGLRMTAADLPQGMAYGKLNDTPGLARTTSTPHEDFAWLIRQNVKLDKLYNELPNQIVNPVKLQTMGLMQWWMRKLNTDLVSNNPGSASGEAGGPVGWRVRLASSANRKKYGHNDQCLILSGGVDLTSSMGKEDALQLLELMSKVLSYVGDEEGDDTVIYMNDDLKRRVETAIKLIDGGGGLKTTTDGYDRGINLFKRARLRDIGRQTDDLTPIIPNTESIAGVADGSSTYTSMFAVKYSDDGITGWQNKNLDLEKVGINDDGTQMVYLLEWLAGLYYGSDRTVVQLAGLKMS